jgi:RND family efflux transporter MFP subunit
MSARISAGRALVVAVLAAAQAGCGRHEEAAAVPPRAVLTAPVQIRDASVFGPFIGAIQPRYASNLGFQIGGRVVAREVSIGDRVAKGQRLARLDGTLPQFQLASAQADLANADAQLANAQATEERQQALLQTGTSTPAQVDSAEAALSTAQARLTQAKANLRAAQNQLGYTELTADYAGVVTALSAEVGQVVSAGQTIVTVARPDVREAVIDVPDALIGSVTRDAAFQVTLLADANVAAVGRVREIEPLSDAATRTRRVRLSLDAPPSGFRLGSTISVAQTETIPPQVVVPATALFDDGGSSAIWVADPSGGIVKKVAARIIERDGDSAIIDAALSAGARVVTAGAHSLKDGQSVAIDP